MHETVWGTMEKAPQGDVLDTLDCVVIGGYLIKTGKSSVSVMPQCVYV